MGRHSFTPTHRDVPDDEAVDVLTDYERRNRFAAPVVRWVLSRLVGWRYDGTNDRRRQLLQEVPLACFSPVDPAIKSPC